MVNGNNKNYMCNFMLECVYKLWRPCRYLKGNLV